MEYNIIVGRNTMRKIADNGSRIHELSKFRNKIYFLITPENNGMNGYKEAIFVEYNIRRPKEYNGLLDVLARFGVVHYTELASKLKMIYECVYNGIMSNSVKYNAYKNGMAPSFYITEFVFDDDKAILLPVLG